MQGLLGDVESRAWLGEGAVMRGLCRLGGRVWGGERGAFLAAFSRGRRPVPGACEGWY